MSYTEYSDTIITISSSFDSGGDVSKDPIQTEAYAPHKEIESHLSDLPDHWKPPSQPFARFCFTQLCLITLRKPDLEELWQEVRQEDSWYNRIRLDDLGRLRSSQFLNIIAYAVTMFTLPTSIENTDRTSKENYEVLMLLLPPLMFVGPICHLCFAYLLIIGGRKSGQILTPKPRKMVVLSYLVVFRTASLLFAMAWAFLGTCGFIFFLGVNPVDYWMIIAGSRDMQALALRGVVAFILWSGFALGYLLSTQL